MVFDTPGATPVRVVKGAARQRRLTCGSAECVAGRAVDRVGAEQVGVHYVPRELTGRVGCHWCGNIWRVLPADMGREAR